MLFSRDRKNFDGDQAGGGGGVNMATGLPFAPNVATTSPSSTSTIVKPSKGFLEGIDRGQQAFGEQETALKDQAAAQAQVAQGQADIMNGYAPGAFQTDDPFEHKLRPSLAAQEQAHLEERARLRAEHQQRIKQAHEQYDQRYKAAVDAQNDHGGWWESKDSETKAMARVGIFLSAIGSGLAGGTENKALAYIQDQVKQDAERKAKRGEMLMRLAEQSKGALRDAYQERAEELSDLDLNYAAGLKAVTNQAELYAKTMLPKQLQVQAQEKIALLHNESAKAYQEAHEKLNGKIEANSGHTVTTVGLGSQGAKGTPSTNDVVDYSTFEELDKKATRLDELTKKGEVPTPEQMDQYANRVNQIVSQQMREAHGGTAQVVLGKVGRALDALPKSAYPDDMTPGQREWLRLHTEMGHQVAVKKFGQSAMSNPESYHEYVDPLLYTRGKTQEEGVELAGALSQQMHTTFRNLREVSKAGTREQIVHANDGAAGAAATNATSAKPSELAPKTESVAALIAKGRALKAAGDIAGAKRIHDQIRAQIGDVQ